MATEVGETPIRCAIACSSDLSSNFTLCRSGSLSTADAILPRMRAALLLSAAAVLALAEICTAGGPPRAVGQVFPPDNAWNMDISQAPVHPRSAAFIASIGAAGKLHADFGTTYRGAPNGIPYDVVGRGQARVPVAFKYADESDPGPYPIPPNARIEGGPAA